MDAQVASAVLRELGVLLPGDGARGSAAAPYAPDADHGLRLHTPLWAHDLPLAATAEDEGGARPIFEAFQGDPGLDGVLARTRLAVFLGAKDSPSFRHFLDAPGVVLVILEPDPARLEAFARGVPASRLARRAVILSGAPGDYLPPLAETLPEDIFRLGPPAVYALAQLLEERPQFCQEHTRLVELLFYRHSVYPAAGQENNRGLPMRPMLRGLFYDQQLHAYQNSAAYVRCPDIRALRKAFHGETAVLAAAGPDLAQRLDYLRDVRERAVIIAVNNALKPLLAAGVRPHFVVANDTSVLTARSWQGLPPLPDVALVAHCLTDLGGGVFGRTYLFGNCQPEVFGARPNLRLHGSVVTTAFSLARHMGCARCVLAGVELGSRNPWGLSYAPGSIHAGAQPAPPPGEHRLYSLVNALGRECFTTPNFLDAAQWLLDEIRASGLPCVNLTAEGLAHGPGIVHDPAWPVEASGRLAARLSRLALQRHQPRPAGPALEALDTALAGWSQVAASVAGVLALSGGAFLRAADEALRQFDARNISYLVQRFEDFDNRAFHRAVFDSGDPDTVAAGLRSYLDYVRRMALQFCGVLGAQRALLAGPGTEHATD